jgi:transcriptional regulator with XRE-family HTH domain
MTTQSALSMTDICRKLRSLRKAQSLSLADVESLSKGRIKAVVLGSYERGSRTLSVKRALEIAALYGIPAAELFREHIEAPNSRHQAHIIDLRKLKSVNNSSLYPLVLFCSEIQRRREDWNGEVISLRHSDFDFLAITSRASVENLEDLLTHEHILITGN